MIVPCEIVAKFLKSVLNDNDKFAIENYIYKFSSILWEVTVMSEMD